MNCTNCLLLLVLTTNLMLLAGLGVGLMRIEEIAVPLADAQQKLNTTKDVGADVANSLPIVAVGRNVYSLYNFVAPYLKTKLQSVVQEEKPAKEKQH